MMISKLSTIRFSRNAFARLGMVAMTAAGFMACTGGGAAAIAAPAENTGTAASGTAATTDALTLSVKYIEFTDAAGKPVMTKEEATQSIADINKLYKHCNIQFVMGDYVNVDPAKLGLDYKQTDTADMDKIRNQFQDDKQLLVIDTGPWSHSSMGSANAWTAMPGSTPSGAVFESIVATDGNIVGHELGHYLGLDHVSDQSNMMNPVIYGDSTAISQDQCDTMRQVAKTDRAQALR